MSRVLKFHTNVLCCESIFIHCAEHFWSGIHLSVQKHFLNYFLDDFLRYWTSCTSPPRYPVLHSWERKHPIFCWDRKSWGYDCIWKWFSTNPLSLAPPHSPSLAEVSWYPQFPPVRDSTTETGVFSAFINVGLELIFLGSAKSFPTHHFLASNGGLLSAPHSPNCCGTISLNPFTSFTEIWRDSKKTSHIQSTLYLEFPHNCPSTIILNSWL